MGFCLFRDAGEDGLYFAVNSSHVEDVAEQGPLCLIKLSCKTGKFVPLAAGTAKQVRAILKTAAKIGIAKTKLRVLGGSKSSSLLLNDIDRVALVRELLPEEFSHRDADFTTASEMFLHGAHHKRIVERPGVFAFRANQGGKVPVLHINPQTRGQHLFLQK